MRSKEEMKSLFQEAENKGLVKKYNKYGTVEVRLAKDGEKIDTIINGKLETTNKAGSNDVVVKNPTGELYILSRPKFLSRYAIGTVTTEFKTAKATGYCYAFVYTGKPFTFMAPWGEKMIVENKDFIAQSAKGNYDDIYRIAREAFKRTYRPAKG